MLQLIVSDRDFMAVINLIYALVMSFLFQTAVKDCVTLGVLPKPSMCPLRPSITLFFFYLNFLFYSSWESNPCGVCDSCTLPFFTIDSFKSRNSEA